MLSATAASKFIPYASVTPILWNGSSHRSKFPAFAVFLTVLPNYAIKPGYTVRLDNDVSIETGQTDTCQDEVYAHARKLFDAAGYKSVIDVGTGSGFKLMKYFKDAETLGTDIGENLRYVKKTYPDRKWKSVPFSKPVQGFDLLICADVIEHIVDPDQLMKFIVGCKPQMVVISTPDRDNLQSMFADGPPKNLSHVREWTGPEFHAYMNQFLNVMGYVLPPKGSSTQFLWGEIL